MSGRYGMGDGDTGKGKVLGVRTPLPSLASLLGDLHI